MDKDKQHSTKHQPNNQSDSASKTLPAVKGVQKATPKISYELRKPAPDMPEELLGRDGPEPTRYGDWEVDGKCTDF